MLKGVSVGSPALGPLHLSNIVSGPGYYFITPPGPERPRLLLVRPPGCLCMCAFFTCGTTPTHGCFSVRAARATSDSLPPRRQWARNPRSARSHPSRGLRSVANDLVPKATQRERGHYKRAGCSAQRAGVPDSRAGQGLHKGPIPWTRVTVVAVRVCWTCARVSTRETACALTSTCRVDQERMTRGRT